MRAGSRHLNARKLHHWHGLICGTCRNRRDNNVHGLTDICRHYAAESKRVKAGKGVGNQIDELF